VLGTVVKLPTGAIGVIGVIGVIGAIDVLLQGGPFSGVELGADVGACTTASIGGVTGDLAGALMVTPCVTSPGGVTGAFTSDGGIQALMVQPVR
jgi:hypothetical protein